MESKEMEKPDTMPIPLLAQEVADALVQKPTIEAGTTISISGSFTLEDIRKLMASMMENDRPVPEMLAVSPDTMPKFSER